MNRHILHFGLINLFAACTTFAVPEVIFDNTALPTQPPPYDPIGVGIERGQTLADDVTFGGTSREITEILIGFVYTNLSGLNMSADVTAYLYDVGPLGLPGNVLFSATQTGVSFADNAGPLKNLIFPVPNVVVPNTIRWGVSVDNLVNITISDVFGPRLPVFSPGPTGAFSNPGNGTAAGGGMYLRATPTGAFTPIDVSDNPDTLAVRITSNNVVPEPTTAALLGLGALIFRAFRRR